ncbi:MAG TPA: PEGA domain-containing protein [Verrucomicrobiae bacterium]
MKTSILAVLSVAALLSGCAASGPAISKSDMGNLEVNIWAPEGMQVRAARIYVDDVFVGNTSERMPILYLKRGNHTLRVELDGTETCQQTIAILGDPNHQVLNAILKKK